MRDAVSAIITHKTESKISFVRLSFTYLPTSNPHTQKILWSVVNIYIYIFIAHNLKLR